MDKFLKHLLMNPKLLQLQNHFFIVILWAAPAFFSYNFHCFIFLKLLFLVVYGVLSNFSLAILVKCLGSKYKQRQNYKQNKQQNILL